jgi:hypothetical protein
MWHRDIYLIKCRLDHVGLPESADPDVFVYAVQEVLCVFLEHKTAVMDALRKCTAAAKSEEIIEGWFLPHCKCVDSVASNA